MASLASGVAVVTARRTDGHPCGLAATSVTSYSAAPPSLLVSIDHASRCHLALAGCERFGVLHGGHLDHGEPLLYARRRMDWLLRPAAPRAAG